MKKNRLWMIVILLLLLVIGVSCDEDVTEVKRYSIGNLISDNYKDECIIKGKIIAEVNDMFILGDDTGMVYVPKENISFNIEDSVEIKGKYIIIDKTPHFQSITSVVKLDTPIINQDIRSDELDLPYTNLFNATSKITNLNVIGVVTGDYIIDDDTKIKVYNINSKINLNEYDNKVVNAKGYLVSNKKTELSVYILELKQDEIPVQTVSIRELYSLDLDKTYEVVGCVSYTYNNTLILNDKEYNIVCELIEDAEAFSLGDTVKITGNLKLTGKKLYLDECSIIKEASFGVVDQTTTNLTATDITSMKNIQKVRTVCKVIVGTITKNGLDIFIENEYANVKILNFSYPLSDMAGTKVSCRVIICNATSDYLEGYVFYITEIKEEDYNINNIIHLPLNTKVTVSGAVVAINNNGFVIGDSTGFLYIYKGSSWHCDISVNDYVEVTGSTASFGMSVQLGNDTTYEVKGTQDMYLPDAVKLDNSTYYSLFEGDIIASKYMTYTGELVKSGSYYNILLSDCNYTGAIAYPKEGNYLDSIIGTNVTVTGFVINQTGTYVNMVMKDIVINDAPTSNFQLTILEINDLHGYCLQDSYKENGISNLAYLVNNIRNRNELDDVVLIGNGDLFQGTAVSNINYGLPIIKAMNVMDFDCMVLGNHEFDWGIDKILKYFDNDPVNGEADFPLLCANIYNNDHSLLTINNGKMFESTIIEKEGIKVGVIGYIGDVYSSISYVMRKDYYFDNNIASSVSSIGKSLKDAGADVIVVSIHGGDASDITQYTVNQNLANLKYNNDYLVDAVINGHTHSYQNASISRNNGTSLPLVQGGSNCGGLGQIVLEIDMTTKDVVKGSSTVYSVSNIGSDYDKEVEDTIQTEVTKLAPILNEVYAVAGETVSYKSQLQNWVGNVILKGTGADVAICNTGGLRATGDIVKGENITIENMYMINPFDNYLMIVDIKGNDLNIFLGNSSIFYSTSGVTIKDNETYKVAVIDYVYYWDYFPGNNSAINSNIIMRDLLIEDVKLHSVFKPISEPKALVGNMLDVSKVNGTNYEDKVLYLNINDYCFLDKRELLYV